MGKFSPRCPRCNGQVLQDHEERKCLQCGHTIDSVLKASEFYEYNRCLIQPLIKTLAPKEFSKVTSIPLGSVQKIKERWVAAPKLDPAPVSTPAPNGRLPELPAFSDSWHSDVQLAWLGIWLTLKQKEREEVKNT